MLLGAIFERFVQQSPVTVMVRGILERILSKESLDELFEKTAKTGYTRELLFSTLVNLMSVVVCSIRPSVGAVYKAMSEEIGVSRNSSLRQTQRHRATSERCFSRIYCQ